MIKTTLLSAHSTSGNVALASWGDLTESPARSAPVQGSVSKYGVQSDKADKQQVNNPERSLFNMNESPGVSYQQCHMFTVMLLQQHRLSGGGRELCCGGGVLEKNSYDVSGRHAAKAAASGLLAEARAQSEPSQLPANYPVSMDIQVQVERRHRAQPHSDLEPWQHHTGFGEALSPPQLKMIHCAIYSI